MASPQVGSVSTRLSFAKVAAMQPPIISSTTGAQILEDQKSRTTSPPNGRKMSQNTKVQMPALLSESNQTRSEESIRASDINRVAGAIEGLSMVKDSLKVTNGINGAESGESIEDDQSHFSISSSKQQSFDTKSMASVTTFAMDEKESIRPDDSASVRAAEEDEESNEPTKNLGFPNDNDMIMLNLRGAGRKDSSNVSIPPRRYRTIVLSNPPRFGDLPANPILDIEATDAESSTQATDNSHEDRNVQMPAPPTSPDERLIEALASPKERLPLLQLEERLLAFILQSKVDFMDLPPQNSFARLLAHKLSDYYGLAHHVIEDGSSMRIFRTPYLTLPTSLATLASSIFIGSNPPSGSTAVKIMRRAGLGPIQSSIGGSTAASSSAPSKTTSEAGVETISDEGITSPSENTPGQDKSKLTREEREAQYKAVRERIFSDFQESVISEEASTGENSASMSRSSSSSGRRKNRKQKNPKDDSFEARSAFIPSFTAAHLSSMQSPYQPQYTDHSYQMMYGSGGGGSGYRPNINYGMATNQSFSGYDQTVPFNNSGSYEPGSQTFTTENWQNMQPTVPNGYANYQQGTPGFPQNMAGGMHQIGTQYMPNSGQMISHPQSWMNNQYQNQYPQHPNQSSTAHPAWRTQASPQGIGNTSSYNYGQLQPSNNTNTPTYASQHPLPGSFARSLFNPQTRSFVPSNNASRHGTRNGRKKSLPVTSPNRNGTPQKGFGSDNATTDSTFSRGLESRGETSIPEIKEDSLQQKYGAPAHLPKKPPPSQVLSNYDVEGRNNVAQSSVPTVINTGDGGDKPTSA